MIGDFFRKRKLRQLLTAHDDLLAIIPKNKHICVYKQSTRNILIVNSANYGERDDLVMTGLDELQQKCEKEQIDQLVGFIFTIGDPFPARYFLYTDVKIKEFAGVVRLTLVDNRK